MTFGWTFEHIDEFVTLPQLKEMSEYWKTNPPLHWKAGKKRAIAGETAMAENAMPAFLRDFAAAGGALPDLETI
jgi:hypothetical protein